MIPEQRTHAKGADAYGTLAVTHGISRYTRAKTVSAIGKRARMFARLSTLAGERGAEGAVVQHHASDRRGVEEHPSRQIGTCEKTGSAYGVDITVIWGRLAASLKQAGRGGGAAPAALPAERYPCMGA
ncbi:catalase [Burkholderia sp. D-99]|uniref:catalase n=1 Tax=Burkholderia sp. D-99 TaxID=2717316 RepID=UPI00387E804E